MHILGPVEVWRATSTDAIVSENLDCPFLEELVRDKVEEVVRGKVADRAAVCELYFRPCWPNDDWSLFVLCGFELGWGRYQGLRGPVFD